MIVMAVAKGADTLTCWPNFQQYCNGIVFGAQVQQPSAMERTAGVIIFV